MTKQNSKEKISKSVKTTQAIYQDFLIKLENLKIKQNKIVMQFIKDMEERRIEEIKKSI